MINRRFGLNVIGNGPLEFWWQLPVSKSYSSESFSVDFQIYLASDFKKRAHLASFIYLFLSFLSTVQKNSVASGIRIQIFGVEGKDADH